MNAIAFTRGSAKRVSKDERPGRWPNILRGSLRSHLRMTGRRRATLQIQGHLAFSTWMAGTSPAMTAVMNAGPSRRLDVLLKTRIDQFALHQRQRRLVVQ